MLVPVGYEALGYATWYAGGRVADPLTPWYIDLGGAVAGGLLFARYPLAGRAQAVKTGQILIRAVSGTASWAARTRVGVASITATTFLAAAAFGYTIGAVVGTGISQAVWGKAGARHALDFYTGKGKYGEYFDVVTNVGTIYNAYFSGTQ